MVSSNTWLPSASIVNFVFLTACTFNSRKVETGGATGVTGAGLTGTGGTSGGASDAATVLGAIFSGAAEAGSAGIEIGAAVTLRAALRAARLAARHARTRRVPSQPPAASNTTTTAANPQASHGRSGVTLGGLPVHTGTVGRSFTASAYSATIFSSSRPR